jgi:pimeloyl-ACP methyl ester carboxylesterase
VEPLASESVELAGHPFPLAADYTAALAMLMARERPAKIAFSRFLQPEKYAYTAKLTRLQLYDPKRTPVIFVHGLDDTPACWSRMINSFRGDPEVRRRYQLWVYSYPSGFPYPYAAGLFREALDGINREFPGHKPIVLVGHSMGGMVCRLMVTDVGDKLWVFNHRPEVRRVIFMSTPHRGSKLASFWLGRIVAARVRTPSAFARIRREAMPLVVPDPAVHRLHRMPNAVDTLSPRDRFVQAINQFPIAASVRYHSIIGDRGRGDTPRSSDGVVPYWSSHLDGAESELVVPSGHGTQLNQEAIAEVGRILKEHRD